MKLTLQEIGTPKSIQTKWGLKEKSYVKAKEYEGKFLNYWLGEQTKAWKIGDIIDVENVESKDYTAKDGSLKTSFNIKLPRTGFAEILNRIEKLENEVAKIKLHLSNQSKVVEIEYPSYEGQPNFDPKENPPF